jgi:hypothetical protein
MLNQCTVLYEKDKGIIAFKGRKVVFQDRKIKREKPLKVGLGIIEKDTIIDKGNYCFGNFKNVDSYIPKEYYKISFFENVGVPLKIEKGYYGENVFLKEHFLDKIVIKAFNKKGEVIFYENKIVKKDNFKGRNLYFNRINELIINWEDITENVHSKVYKSIKKLKGVDNFLHKDILEAIKTLLCNDVYKTKNNVIIAEGKFEHLVVWQDKNISMAWLGKKLNLENYNIEKINKKYKKNKI